MVHRKFTVFDTSETAIRDDNDGGVGKVQQLLRDQSVDHGTQSLKIFIGFLTEWAVKMLLFIKRAQMDRHEGFALSEELYRFMVDKFHQTRAFFLEVTVIIILVIELASCSEARPSNCRDALRYRP